MPTFEITIYIGYQNINPPNLSLLISLAAIEGLDIGIVSGLQKGPPPSKLQSLVVEKDSIFFQYTYKMALY